MTTTVTIKTHGQPAQISITDEYSVEDPTAKRNGYNSSREFIAPNSEREVTVTNIRSISVSELPAEATDLDHADRLRFGEGLNASGSQTVATNAARPGANIHGIGPDTDGGPNPDYNPDAFIRDEPVMDTSDFKLANRDHVDGDDGDTDSAG